MSSAESLFEPIRTEAIRAARSRLAYEGLSVEEWAGREGFKAKSVYQVLSGKRMAIRGASLRIAIKLGLRPDPSVAVEHAAHDAHPPVRAVPLIGSIGSGNRAGKLSLGEPVR